MSDETSLQQRYDTHVARIASLPTLMMRVGSVRELFEHMDPQEGVWWMDQLLRGTLWGHAQQADALLALSVWLIHAHHTHYELLKRLFEAAHEERRQTVMYMLRDAPPHRALAQESKLPEVRLPIERDVTLGERRSIATGPNLKLLDRLVDDPNPLVIERLLNNPRIRESHVIAIAAKRPTLPKLLDLVARHPKWIQRPTVREAVVRNPFNTTGVCLKLVPTLGLPLLYQLKNASDIHPGITAFASDLVELREARTAPLKV